jgi:hypothetical protein
MNQYDELINRDMAVIDDTIVETENPKITTCTRICVFEQSKFYGKDKHGMFVINKEVK